jgi:class 3 adenylate cyclase
MATKHDDCRGTESMTVSNLGRVFNDAPFHERFDRLRASYANHDNLVAELERFVRTAPDDQIVRINPIQYAADHGRDESEIIDLFLHARKAGLLGMEWHYACRGCGQIVESLQTLNAAGEHYFCNTCLVNRDTDLSDFVEIGFTVSKAVRTSRFHDPENLSAKERVIDYNISANAIWMDGTKARDFFRRHHVFCTYVEPGENRTFQVNLEPGFFVLRYGPGFIVDPSSDNRVERIGITHRDGRPAEPTQTVAPGSLTYNLTNASPARIIAYALSITAAERRAYSGTPQGFRLGGFLSGSRLLSTQTFLDLFPSETVMSAGGLAVKRVALLFTDIKGSTALYDRIGDMKAFNLVRQHFGVLRDVIAANRGALVKTIGDAVMASFHEPLNAIRAALDMLAQIRRFNDSVGEELITLKIGAHVGHCLAVTLNGRLDYFGQTVNLAARVQGLAAENDIYMSDEIYRLPGAADLLAAMQCEAQTVHVKGIAREIGVHALRSRRQGRP